MKKKLLRINHQYGLNKEFHINHQYGLNKDFSICSKVNKGTTHYGFYVQFYM